MTLATEHAELVSKFETLDLRLNGDLVERAKEIKTAQVALISGTHHFQVGPPGTAKSLLVRRLFAYLSGLTDEDYFEWLLTKYSTPEEIFGPPSLKALEEDHYSRNTRGKLPVSKIAFLDEIFKANSSILNALLTIMNERIFHNNGDRHLVGLSSVFSASNELPHGDELNAMWDRLHFRHEIRPVQDGGNFVRMLSGMREANPEKVLAWAEVEEAQRQAANVELPSDVYDALKTLRDNLRKEGVEPTERRFVESLKIIRATAWLHGRMVADIDDMKLLRHVMWNRVEDQKVVEKAVLELANPIDKEANDLLEQVEVLGSQLDEAIRNADTPKALAKQAVEIHAKLNKAKSEMDSLKKRATASGRKSEKLEELQTRFVQIGKVLMRECFGLDSPNGGEQPKE